MNRSRLLLVGSLGCGAAAVLGLWFEYHHWQFALWLLGLALLVAAFSGRRATPMAAPEPWTRGELALFAAIVLLGAFFRLYRLGVLPPGLWVDEIYVSGRAEQLMLHKPFLPFGFTPLTWLENWVQTSNLYLYSIVLIFRLCGYGYWSIKMISAVPGVLGVPALYLFCRELAGKRTAVSAGLLFAVGHWNARLSRWGWDEVAMTTLQIVSAYFLVRGFRRREPASFVWSGIAMGACLNTYIASRLALAAALASLALHLISRWGGWRERAKPLATFAAATALSAAPLAVFYLRHPELFNVRASEVSIFRRVELAKSYAPLIDNLKIHLAMFHLRGDAYAKHDLPNAPMLDPVTGALFVVGLAMALWRWRSPGYALLHCWLWIGLLAGVLSYNYGLPHAYRTGNLAPAAIALAALPLGWMLERFRARGAAKAASIAIAAGVLGAAVALNYQNLFVRWAHLGTLWGEMLTSRGTTVARHILSREKEDPVLVSRWARDGGFGALMESEISGNRSRVKNWNPDYWNGDTDPPLADVAGDAVFYCNPAWETWMRGWYPHMRWQELRNAYGDVYCAVAEIPSADVHAVHGLRRTVSTAAQALSPFASLVFAGLDGTSTLFEGSYDQRARGFVTFGAPDGGVAGVWVDGRRILESGDRVSSEERIDVGMHSVAFLVAGDVERPPAILQRQRWVRGVEVPLENLSPSIDSGAKGLRGTFFGGASWQGEPLAVVEAAAPGIDASHPPPPYSATWEGVLRADVAGDYVIGAAMNDGGSVAIDGKRLIESKVGYAEETIELSAGWHRIELRYYDTGNGGQYLSLYWIPPRHKDSVSDGQWANLGFRPMDDESFYHLPFAGRGLRARYYANTELKGPPFLDVVESEQWLAHHQGQHFSVELDGTWYFPESGRYWLGLDSDDGSWLYLDDQLVIDNGGVHGFGPAGKEIDVRRGPHRVRVRYFQDTGGAGLRLLWARQGGEPYPVVPVFLYPPEDEVGFPD